MKIDKFQLSMIRGAIAKRFVVKHYRGGKIVVTKYPAMQGIIASDKQRVRRRLFKHAVKYAQKVFANPALKEEKRRALRRPRRLFQALMKEWFRTRKEKQCRAERRIERWRRNVRNNGGCWKVVKMLPLLSALPKNPGAAKSLQQAVRASYSSSASPALQIRS